MAYRPKHIAEYVAMRLVVGLVQIVPYRVLLFLGWTVAGLTFLPGRKRRRETERRIASVLGPDTSPKRLHHIAWMSWRNTIFNTFEALRIPKTSAAWVEKHFDPGEMLDAMAPERDAGRGAIIALPHTGNWEMAGLACHVHRFPIIIIVGKQRNPLTNDYLHELRAAAASVIIERGTDVMRPIMRHLKKGKYLAILPDVRMPYPDLSIPFLGGTANLGSGMALFARMTNLPIYPCCVVRDGWTRHRIAETYPVVRPDKTLDKTEDIERMTASVIANFDAAIRKYPEQWFWHNKRWVLDPVKQQETEDKHG
ncbi:MAG: lysophospholipid acyltransferase family protein [Kiritimatiellae bacterium]|nr:lysophospholipid acyltransferase family protein [Kiritimatiellia bacterium]